MFEVDFEFVAFDLRHQAITEFRMENAHSQRDVTTGFCRKTGGAGLHFRQPGRAHIKRLADGPLPARPAILRARHVGEGIGLLMQLIADTLVAEDPLDWPKGSTWLLQRDDRRQVLGRLLAPLELELAEP